MNSVLLVSSNEKASQMLVSLVKTENSPQISSVENGSGARRTILNNDYDLVVINAPLIDEFGHDLAITMTEKTSAGIILLVKNEVSDQIAEKVENFGVLVVSKPVIKQLFYQAVKLANASRKRMMGLQNENEKLQNKIGEIRLIDRAKCALIQYLKLTEPQAHRYIEKQAMDMRITRREVAEGILKTYEC